MKIALSSIRSMMSDSFGQFFRGARVTSKNDEWVPQPVSGDAAVAMAWPTLTTRIRDMAANDSVFQKALIQLVTMVIGGGINTYANATLPDNTDLEDWNAENDTWFERWSETEADADGNLTLGEMQRLMFQETAEVGNALMMRVMKRGKDRISPIAYRMVEWEQLAHSYTSPAFGPSPEGLPDGHRIQNGVEYSRSNEKVAFWIHLDHPYNDNIQPGKAWEPTRVPASRIIHSYLPSRISSTVGVSWFAAMLATSKDRDKLVANTLTSTGIASLLTLVWKSNKHGVQSGLNATDAQTGHTNIRMGNPFIAKVGQQDDVQVAESTKGLFELQSFLNYISNQEAMGAKMSVNRLLGDPTRANLASIRASHEDDDAMMQPIRQNQSKHALRIRREWTSMAVGTGRLQTISPVEFQNANWRFQSYETIASQRGDISPGENIEAAINALRSGLTTFKRECSKRGLHWRRVLRDIKHVNEVTRELGVTLDWTKGNGGDNVATTTDAEAQRKALENTSSQEGTAA